MSTVSLAQTSPIEIDISAMQPGAKPADFTFWRTGQGARAEWVRLLTATETAVKANPGSQAVSIYPQLQNGQAVAEVTLLQGTVLKKVTEKLD